MVPKRPRGVQGVPRSSSDRTRSALKHPENTPRCPKRVSVPPQSVHEREKETKRERNREKKRSPELVGEDKEKLTERRAKIGREMAREGEVREKIKDRRGKREERGGEKRANKRGEIIDKSEERMKREEMR